jgi:hypothetical protein
LVFAEGEIQRKTLEARERANKQLNSPIWEVFWNLFLDVKI